MPEIIGEHSHFIDFELPSVTLEVDWLWRIQYRADMSIITRTTINRDARMLGPIVGSWSEMSPMGIDRLREPSASIKVLVQHSPVTINQVTIYALRAEANEYLYRIEFSSSFTNLQHMTPDFREQLVADGWTIS